MKILIIGNNTRYIVSSAKKSGHTVYALDGFGDVDTLKYSDKCVVFKENISDKEIYELADSFGEIDGVILGNGFENLKFENIFSNKPEIMDELHDKFKLSEKLDSMGIPHPLTRNLEDYEEIEFPLILKPKKAAGGVENVLVNDETELLNFMDKKEEYIAQEFIKGIPCSISLIGNGEDSEVIAVNRQLIGVSWLTKIKFAYCGNLTPFDSGYNSEIMGYAKEILREFELKGSVGVDFMATDKGAVVIEVNARFQGSLDTIENSMNINIFDAHINSFYGKLPKLPKASCISGKGILFSDKKIRIDEFAYNKLLGCMESKKAADIPKLNSVIYPDEPITTILEKGNFVIDKIKRKAEIIKSLF